MKKSVLFIAVAVMLLGTMSVSFAGAAWSPAQTFGEMKKMTEQEAYEYRAEQNKRFGELAEAEGEEFYVEFRQRVMDAKKEMLKEMVELGKISQERADEVMKAIEDCNGTQMRALRGTGLFGNMNGEGFGGGFGAQKGQGQGGMMRRGAWDSN